MVIIISAFSATPQGLATVLAPSLKIASRGPEDRVVAMTFAPAFIKFKHMGKPIRPRPTKPIDWPFNDDIPLYLPFH
jgi:hypothetical protein